MPETPRHSGPNLTIPAASAAGAGAAPIDTETLLRRCMGRAALAATLLGKFEKQARGDLAVLTEMVGRGDRDLVIRTAHALKGAAAAVSADKVRDAASTLETAGRDGAAEMMHAMAALAREVEACLNAIPGVAGGLSASGAATHETVARTAR